MRQEDWHPTNRPHTNLWQSIRQFLKQRDLWSRNCCKMITLKNPETILDAERFDWKPRQGNIGTWERTRPHANRLVSTIAIIFLTRNNWNPNICNVKISDRKSRNEEKTDWEPNIAVAIRKENRRDHNEMRTPVSFRITRKRKKRKKVLEKKENKKKNWKKNIRNTLEPKLLKIGNRSEKFWQKRKAQENYALMFLFEKKKKKKKKKKK